MFTAILVVTVFVVDAEVVPTKAVPVASGSVMVRLVAVMGACKVITPAPLAEAVTAMLLINYPTIQIRPLSKTGIDTEPPPTGAEPNTGARALVTCVRLPAVPAAGRDATVYPVKANIGAVMPVVPSITTAIIYFPSKDYPAAAGRNSNCNA